jgi:hypothetical protein
MPIAKLLMSLACSYQAFPMVGPDALSRARTICKPAPDLAEQVLARTHSIVEAFDKMHAEGSS